MQADDDAREAPAVNVRCNFIRGLDYAHLERPKLTGVPKVDQDTVGFGTA
jgi:hypothetical protein